ncbi:MAG TPA: hypothetical protein VIX20_19080, partial [Ktedonobacteraceae bacterium]
MKRLVFLLLACGAIVLVTIVASFQPSSNVQATAGTNIHMFSGTFSDQPLSTDGITKITLVSIPFGVSIKSKLEATSLMNVTNTGGGTGSYATCELDIDNVSFFNVTTSLDGSAFDALIPTTTSVSITGTTIGIAV